MQLGEQFIAKVRVAEIQPFQVPEFVDSPDVSSRDGMTFRKHACTRVRDSSDATETILDLCAIASQQIDDHALLLVRFDSVADKPCQGSQKSAREQQRTEAKSKAKSSSRRALGGGQRLFLWKYWLLFNGSFGSAVPASVELRLVVLPAVAAPTALGRGIGY
jgi:hypothetical protein